MDAQTEHWLKETLGPAHDHFARSEDREKAADDRTTKIIQAIEDGFKRQNDIIERGLKAIADALRQR